jgi:hypothetical protein
MIVARSSLIFLLFSSTLLAAEGVDYNQRIGLRLSAGVSGYTAVGSQSYGYVIPLELEGTYGITRALEVMLGFRGAASIPVQSIASYALPYTVSSGLRYYYNVDEPVSAYTAIAVNVGLDRFGFEVSPSTWGLQWDINDNISVFGDGGLGFLVGSNPIRRERWEFNLRFGVNVGVHYHF